MKGKISRRKFVKTSVIAFWAVLCPGYFELFLGGEPVEHPAIVEHDKPEIISVLEQMVDHMRFMAGNPPNLGFTIHAPPELHECLMEMKAEIDGVVFSPDYDIRVAHGPGGLMSSEIVVDTRLVEARA